MNREEAIRYCDEYLARHISDIDKEFLKIAKEALQQEPCSNCCDGNQIEKAKLCQKSYLAGMEHKQEACEDAISRQAVLKIIDGWYDNNRDTENIEDLIVLITYMCSVNPQPKTGHWIFDEILDKHYYCSECKSMGVDYWDYCPYCGTKMVESQESEDKCKNCEYYHNPDYTRCHKCKAEGEIHCTYTDSEIAKSFIDDVEAVKDLLPRAESEVSDANSD